MRRPLLTLVLCITILIATATCNVFAADLIASNFSELENVLLQQMSEYNQNFEIKYTGYVDNIEDLEKVILNSISIEPYINSNIKNIQYDMLISAKKNNISVKVNYIMSSNQRTETDKKIKKILSEIIKPTMNDHEKVKAVHDYIVLNGKYDKNMQLYSDYDLLTQGSSVCNGYALLTYNMLKELNIPVKLVTGMGNGEMHIWNMVKLGDYWFHLDTTWDDPLPDTNTVSYNYYMLTEKEILNDHTINENLDLPKANKSYYILLKELSYDKLLMETGLDVYDDVNTGKTEQELSNILKYKIKHRPLRISVRTNKDISQDSINNAMSSLLIMNHISEISYSPLVSDNTGEFNILNLYIKYKETPDSITLDFSNKIYNTATKVNFNIYAIYGNKKDNINDNVLIHPYDKESLNIYNGSLTFKQAGSYNIQFEYQGFQEKATITALNSDTFKYITDTKPINPVNIKVYGHYIDFSSINQWPFIENGRTMVPLRAVFEVMNCDVKWEQDKNSAIVKYKNTTIVIPANSKVAYINGTASSLDSPAKLVNDRIMVPLRFISEAIQKTVIWDDIDKTVLIN